MVVPQNRRSFLAMLGLAPLFAAAPVVAEEVVEPKQETIIPVKDPTDNPNNLPIVCFNNADDPVIATISNLEELLANVPIALNCTQGQRIQSQETLVWLPKQFAARWGYDGDQFYGEVRLTHSWWQYAYEHHKSVNTYLDKTMHSQIIKQDAVPSHWFSVVPVDASTTSNL